MDTCTDPLAHTVLQLEATHKLAASQHLAASQQLVAAQNLVAAQQLAASTAVQQSYDGGHVLNPLSRTTSHASVRLAPALPPRCVPSYISTDVVMQFVTH